MKAKRMVTKMMMVAVVAAVASLVASSAGATGVGGNGAGVVGVYDNAGFRLEIGAVTGQSNNSKVCVSLTSKAANRRASGCGPVAISVHPTLDYAMVRGTVEGTLVQANNGTVVAKSVPIALDLTYQGIGMYQPFVTGPASNLWLYPLDVAVAQGAGVSRAAWGWGSVQAPVCKQSSAAAIRNRSVRNAPVTCGPSVDTPSFAGTIAHTTVARAGVGM